MQALKQSTLITIKLGPFLDKTDGVTEEVALTPGVEVSKNGAAFAARNSATVISHDAEGYYAVELNATDTGALGRLRVKAHDPTLHLPVWQDYMIMPANVWDSLFGADKLQVDLTQMGGVAQSATDLKHFADVGYNPTSGKVVEVASLTGHTAQTADHTAGIAAIPTVMRGTDNAALAVDYNATRAGYLDKLNVTGNVASSAEVTAIQNNTRVRVMVPGTMERPDTGSTAFKLHLYLYDTAGNMAAPDSAPTITAVNQSGVSRAANLGLVTFVSTGYYTVTYTIDTAHLIEQLMFEWTVIENAATRQHGAAAQVVDTTAVDFTAADRAKLDEIHDVRLTAGRAANLDNLDGTITSRQPSGNVTVGGYAVGQAPADGVLATPANKLATDVAGKVTVGVNSDKTGYSISGVKQTLDALKDFDPATQTVDVGKMSGSTVAATNIKDSALRIVTGAAVAGTLSVTAMTTDLTEATNDHYKGRVIVWDDGPLKDQATDVTAYDGTTKKLTFTAVTDVPVAGNKFRII